MELRFWLATFKALHERARKGELAATERAKYMEQREELARTLAVAQRLTTLPGQTLRQSLRVARALQVDLELATGRERVVTLNFSSGGFGALVLKEPAKGTLLGFSMRLPGSAELLSGRARVIETQRRVGNFMASFAFVDLGAAEQERLELALFDAILQQFAGMQF